MADYSTQFSCALDLGSAANAAAALDLLDAMRDVPGDDAPYGFDAEVDFTDPAHIIMTDGRQGEPEHVIAFVLRCAEAFGLTGRWGFTWALTCSKPRLDGFGGGAQLIDLGARASLTWVDCDHWLTARLDPAVAPESGDVRSASFGGA